MKAKGFTLIELLVVITIIGILATGSVAFFSSSQAKARDAVRTGDIQTILTAQSLYQADEGEYANTNANLVPYLNSIPKPPRADDEGSTDTAIAQYSTTTNDKTNTVSAVACGMKDATAKNAGEYTKSIGAGSEVYDCSLDSDSVIVLTGMSDLAGVALTPNTAFTSYK